MTFLWTIMPVVQIVLAIHAYKRGNTLWIWVILFFPGVGAIIYFFAEFLPSLGHDTVLQSVSMSCIVFNSPTLQPHLTSSTLSS
ncbi:MAG: hypothetical protein JW913_19455 [Chitinispirillaceae bacterium]|nr:hypothetical protein [Chitinispirillaceae bacterium]